MKFFHLLILLLLCAPPLQAKIEWQTDYVKLRTISQQEKKPMLLFFNGSDWAGSAMKFKHEILTLPFFKKKSVTT